MNEIDEVLQRMMQIQRGTSMSLPDEVADTLHSTDLEKAGQIETHCMRRTSDEKVFDLVPTEYFEDCGVLVAEGVAPVNIPENGLRLYMLNDRRLILLSFRERRRERDYEYHAKHIGTYALKLKRVVRC